jgi:hypothetical protein
VLSQRCRLSGESEREVVRGKTRGGWRCFSRLRCEEPAICMFSVRPLHCNCVRATSYGDATYLQCCSGESKSSATMYFAVELLVGGCADESRENPPTRQGPDQLQYSGTGTALQQIV